MSVCLYIYIAFHLIQTIVPQLGYYNQSNQYFSGWTFHLIESIPRLTGILKWHCPVLTTSGIQWMGRRCIFRLANVDWHVVSFV